MRFTVCFRWTPPSNSAIMENRDYIRVLLYSYDTTITGWGVLRSSASWEFSFVPLGLFVPLGFGPLNHGMWSLIRGFGTQNLGLQTLRVHDRVRSKDLAGIEGLGFRAGSHRA